MPRRRPFNGWRPDATHCAKGHDLTLPDAVSYRVTGYPMCRACRREWLREYRKRDGKKRRRPSQPGARQRAAAAERVDLEAYFARMRQEEDAPAWEKRKRMWPDDESGGLRRS